MTEAIILQVDDLRIEFRTARGPVQAVGGIRFSVCSGEIFAIVGESGSGKSATAAAILRLLPDNARLSGRILFRGHDVLALRREELRAFRGRQVAMVFQDALSALNPMETVGMQIIEALKAHTSLSRTERHSRALGLLREVGIPDPERRLALYPHEFSGGMRQRALIAMALACDPQLLIADEPTTALDVTLQAQVLELLKHLALTRGMGVILITHDLGVVAETADRVAVMKSGRIVETASTSTLFARPTHPYTKELLRAVPRLDDGELDSAIMPDQSILPSGYSTIAPDYIGTAEELLPVSGDEGHLVACYRIRHAIGETTGV